MDFGDTQRAYDTQLGNSRGEKTCSSEIPGAHDTLLPDRIPRRVLYSIPTRSSVVEALVSGGLARVPGMPGFVYFDVCDEP